MVVLYVQLFALMVFHVWNKIEHNFWLNVPLLSISASIFRKGIYYRKKVYCNRLMISFEVDNDHYGNVLGQTAPKFTVIMIIII